MSVSQPVSFCSFDVKFRGPLQFTENAFISTTKKILNDQALTFERYTLHDTTAKTTLSVENKDLQTAW